VTTAAIIVARSGSRRLPGKAMLPFAGNPLVAHKALALARVVGIDRVYIGSDCDFIIAAGVRAGAVAVKRDAFHCDESRCDANEMLRDMASRVTEDLILWAHPTNPLVQPRTYAAALDVYHQARAVGFDSLVSVQVVRRHAWLGHDPLNHQPFVGPHQAASALEPILFQDGAIFIRPRAELLADPRFCGRKPFLFHMPFGESADIDTAQDYEEAKRCEWSFWEQAQA
jgi:CMP-N-acetylneuraminic acid synthetase